jgi:hypothetical protein
MGFTQDQDDQKSESSVEHEIESSPTSKADQQINPHDTEHPDSNPPESVSRFKVGSTPKAWLSSNLG